MIYSNKGGSSKFYQDKSFNQSFLAVLLFVQDVFISTAYGLYSMDKFFCTVKISSNYAACFIIC